MQPIATITRHEAIDHDELPVRNWRVSQLKRCGIPGAAGRGLRQPHRLASGHPGRSSLRRGISRFW
jgi:hypothetical protein